MRYLAAAITLIAILCVWCPKQANAQHADTVELGIRNKLANELKKYPREKIFLHTDCDLYASGQTIWYKAYAMSYGKPSDLSRIIYVQLVNSAGEVVIQNKLPLKHGLAHGNIDLPDSLKTGWYQLTGFTTWMMNFDEEGFFHQKVYIQNLRSQVKGAGQAASVHKYHIDFFPEGGDPVEGNVCNMAFKATDENDMPVKADGEVLNADKKIVARIITEHDGMGQFDIVGEAGKRNAAIVKFPGGTIQTIDLPQFKKTGVSWRVNTLSPANIEMKIAFAGNINDFRDVVLVAFQNQGKFNTYPLELSNGINVLNIKTTEFATGVLRFTLFDGHGMPLGERVVFVNKNDQLKLSLGTDTLSVEAKGKSAFTLKSFAARDGQATPANFSVSVTDADAGNDQPGDNIYSSLLLNSELKGKIYDRAYYFKSNSDTLRRRLDLVMLTNGWRHFKFDTVKLVYPVEKSQFIAATIENYNRQLYAKNQLQVKMIIQGQDSSKYFGTVAPDSLGRFLVDNYEQSGRSDIYLETVDSKKRLKKLKFKLFYNHSDSLQTYRHAKLDTSADLPEAVKKYTYASALTQRQLLLASNNILLKTVNIKGKKMTPTEEIIANHVTPLYTSVKEYTLDLVNNPSLDIGILEYIKGRFPGLQVVTGNGIPYFSYRGAKSLAGSTVSAGASTSSGPSKSSGSAGASGSSNSSGSPYWPFFYINEAPAFIDDIINLPMSDVALIRFLPAPVVFAPLNGGNVGAILIYTKNSKDDRRGISLVETETFDHYTFNGYTITREFSLPDYSGAGTLSPPDQRTTLYWNHDLNTGPNGAVKFHFYNSDKAKHYRVIIQGMDADGRIGYLNEVF